MKLANPKSKHIAKAAQGYASTKALSKSLLFHPKKKNKKISPASQKLNQLKHKQTDQNNLTIKEAKQLANNEIYTDEQGTTTHNRRLAQWRVTWLIEHSTSHQLLWCIDSFVLRNPPLRQAPKRYIELCKLLRYPKGFSASKGIVDIFGGASRPSSLGGETVQVG